MATHAKEDMSSMVIDGVRLTKAGEAMVRTWLRLHDIRDAVNQGRSVVAMLDAAIDYVEDELVRNEPIIDASSKSMGALRRTVSTSGETVRGPDDVDRAARRGTPKRED